MGSFDSRVRIFRIKHLENPKQIVVLKHHKKMISSIDSRVTTNNELEILAVSEDGDVTLWTVPFVNKK